MRLSNLAEKLSEKSIRTLLTLKRRGAKLRNLRVRYGKLRRQLAALDRKIQKLSTGATSLHRPAARKRRLSPEARKRIAAAQKRRWAAFRAKKAQG